MAWWHDRATLTVRETARVTGLSPKQVSRWIVEEDIPVIRKAGTVLVPVPIVVEHFEQGQMVKAGERGGLSEEARAAIRKAREGR